ncbi:MAG: chitobiase/beta-hexosaminidase C-terminal domain-containing protein, partial [Phycisphaerae bacterium]|nr:chitobiase/beta-hexosaminidase C-terminal domain-containing protein [Gemmatimonadaceae bacterium]
MAGANLPATWEVNLGTNYALERITLWNRTSNRSRLRDITVRVLDVNGTTTNFTSALLNPENTIGGGVVNVGPTNLSLNLTQLTGGLVLGGRVRITRTPDPDLSGSGGAGSGSEADVLSLAEVEVFGMPATTGNIGLFTSSIRTDIGSAMTNINATALIRIPFIIPEEELPVLDRLTLRMKYDDGFVAYLNGVAIARRNAPAAPIWNSAATNSHPDSAALVFEDIDASAHIGLLQEGGNVLAIQALNVSGSDDDLLIVPELTGFKLNVLPERYYATPSPGATNSGGALGLVADTKFSIDRGFYNIPFTVAITSATANAEIRFTTNGEIPSAVNGFIYTTPITINKTTALRAIATKPGWLPSDVDTHTYVFLNNVITQSLAGATNDGFPSTWPGTTPDYAMDPNVTGPYAAQMTNALRSLASLFVTTSISNLFDATTGIYTHPTQHGIAWERAISLEMIGTNGQSEFQENCGLRIQGGAFRGFNYTQKKSLRVLFKSIYGPGKLQHDLFQEPGATEEFDGFVLRAGGNDGYAWVDAGTTVQFIRDEFGRRLHLDMGHPAPRGKFEHLYLNGLYWGLYNLVERA